MTKSESEATTEDHRVRVGAQRREKTRLRLLESALRVYDEKGPHVTVIDDFIVAAGVSRGTFYNHFKTTDELMLALATAMSDEVLQVVDPVVLHHDDPIRRFTTGTRLYMQMAARYPLWGSFITRVGTRIATHGQLIDIYLTRDLELARSRLRVDVRVARDIVLGAVFYGIETMLSNPALKDHPEQILYGVLMGLGLKSAEAEAIAFMPLETPRAIEGPIFSGLKQNVGAARRTARKRPAAA